jgi:hypothetical protein
MPRAYPNPTPEEIERITAEIRSNWTHKEHVRRCIIPRQTRRQFRAAVDPGNNGTFFWIDERKGDKFI